MRIYTIGFKGRTAEEFFEALKGVGIRRLIDVRLRNDSHILGFTKGVHLEYLLREVCGAEYLHEPLLSPSCRPSLRDRPGVLIHPLSTSV